MPEGSGAALGEVFTNDRRVYHLALTSGERTAMVALLWI
jgi:hypothetical protein